LESGSGALSIPSATSKARMCNQGIASAVPHLQCCGGRSSRLYQHMEM
jgi:hypothetical protein